MATKKTKKKQTKLQEAELRIRNLEVEQEYFRQQSLRQSAIINKLEQAAKPFTFPHEPHVFHGTESNFTPCSIRDLDVQRLRQVLQELF